MRTVQGSTETEGTDTDNIAVAPEVGDTGMGMAKGKDNGPAEAVAGPVHLLQVLVGMVEC